MEVWENTSLDETVTFSYDMVLETDFAEPKCGFLLHVSQTHVKFLVIPKRKKKSENCI